MTTKHSGSLSASPSARELEHRALAKELAQEGIVLLKNDGILPIRASETIALFGNGAALTVKGGTGSGDVNNRENISIYQGLSEAGFTITTADWLEDVKMRYQNARLAWKEAILEDCKKVANPFDAYAAHNFRLPDGREIVDADLLGASCAVYVVSRISGEGIDRRNEPGDYLLSLKEKEDLRFLEEKKIPIILIINAGGPVELTDLLEESQYVKAVLNVSQLGQEGGYAVADTLLGKSTPSGKLTSTWVKHYESYPYASEFGYLNGNLEFAEYKEEIFVGYRHFDRSPEEVLYPFGFGLSYTTFSTEYKGLTESDEQYTVEVNVTNTGEQFSGKEVVQVYLRLPEGEGEKELHRLAGFAKTEILAPGASQKLIVSFRKRELASFDETSNSWIISKGDYGVLIGGHDAAKKPVTIISIPKDQTIGLLDEKASCSTDALPETAHSALADTLPCEELVPLLYGNVAEGTGMLGSTGTRVPGSAGETTEALEQTHGIRSLIMADGPAGVRLRQTYEVDPETDTVYAVGGLAALENGFLEPVERHENADLYHQYCTAFPVGTALAQTWNTELLETFGKGISREMEELHVDLWLAPGMNIQRNPLCGRNFEYYSEDPLLTGKVAGAVVRGVQRNGHAGAVIKHFACNNQEDNRIGVDALVSERALREIYLRGFEIAVKESAPVGVMTSYNPLNGEHTANSYKLCTQVLREEWGFGGLVMTDWNTTLPEAGSISWKCATAGNDIIMPGNCEDERIIREALKSGELPEETVRQCAKRIIRVIDRLS